VLVGELRQLRQHREQFVFWQSRPPDVAWLGADKLARKIRAIDKLRADLKDALYALHRDARAAAATP
jgi:hypothetical protein